MLKRTLSALLLVASTFSASATDYTDIWWNPKESGWGVNFAQNGNFIFATFFIYGPNDAPTWYTAHLSLDANGRYAGPLYATSGPWYGAVPFNAAQVAIDQVGSATFQPTAADSGTLSYNVAATQVVKSVQRQTLIPIALAGTYVGGASVIGSDCALASRNGSARVPVNLQVTQSAIGHVELTFDLPNLVSCTFAGPATQSGQLLKYAATYTCSSGGQFSATVYELRATSLGIEGRWTAPSAGGCREEGRFAGVRE